MLKKIRLFINLMNNQGFVILGFANSQGVLSKKIVQEKYQNVERFGVKIQVKEPKIRAKVQSSLDVNQFKSMISQRRNQALLASFLKITDDDERTFLAKVREEARQQIRTISEELNTLVIVNGQVNKVKINKFVNETKANDVVARQYLQQFSNNVELAVQKFRQRMTIVRKFAQKNKITEAQAINILKDNGYNASLFE